MVTMACAGGVFSWPMTVEVQNPFVIVPVAAFAVVGAILARRRPKNSIGWVFLGIGALAGALVISVVLTGWAADRPGEMPWWGLAAAWVLSWTWYPLMYLLTTPTLLLFPSGLLSARWRVVLWVPIAAVLFSVLIAATAPHLAVESDDSGDVLREVANPLSPGFMAGLDNPEDSWIFQLLITIFIAGWVAAIVSAVVRLKRARGVERLQMRWFGFAVAMFVPLIGLEMRYGDDDLLWMALVEAVVLAAVPVSCGIAILRYRLYEIDRIISRTAAYAIVTSILIACYALIVTTVTGLLPDSGSLAVAAATLLVAAAFRPLLRRVRHAVDRRFDREHYDAEQAVGEFAERLRVSNEVAAVVGDLESVVHQVFKPTETVVWIRPMATEPSGRTP